MKKLLLLTLLIPLFSSRLKADFGSCLVYHAKFYLKNGAVFTGCFEVFGYDVYLDNNNTNEFCNDKGVLNALKKKQREYGRVAVFKTLNYVQPRPMRKHSDEELPTYGFLFPNDLVSVDSNDISKMVFWSVEYSNRYWLTSDLIYGSPGMLDTISNQKYWNHLIFSGSNWEKDTIIFPEFDVIDGPFGGYALYNYNPKINIAELKRLVHLKFNFNFDDMANEFKRKHKMTEGQEWTPKQRQQFDTVISQKLQSVYDWFWGKGILVVAINGTC